MAAIAISIISLWFTRQLWVQSNRPIVAAFIQTNSSGNLARTYDIVVVNGGSRPAVDVQLRAEKSHFQAAVYAGAESSAVHKPILDAVRRCFSLDGDIPVLLTIERRINSFGFTGPSDGMGSLWNMGATIPITITYADLEGRTFESRLTLRIKDTEAFAGGLWGK